MEAQPQTESIATNPLTDLTGFQRDLLVAVDDEYDVEKPSGQCVKERVEQYGYDNINHGRLYPNLDTLVEEGLVQKGELDLRTNYYIPTSAGEEALESYREFVGE